MKKNVVEFTTKDGNTYKLNMPTAIQKVEMAEKADTEGEEIKNPYAFALFCVQTCLHKDEDIDALPLTEIAEVGFRAFELASLGK